MKDTDREKRKEAFEKINARRLLDKKRLDELLDELIEKRQLVAKHATDNYIDYKFQAMGRFDYDKADYAAFHKSIAEKLSH